MPTYDYACAACGHRFEVVHGVHGHGPETCPSCAGGPVRRAFAPPTIMFKGSGWAKVDRRPARSSANSDSGDEGSKSKPTTGEPVAPASTSSEDSSGSRSTAKTTD
jgi:putative FmdB family regulatory protein